MILETIPKIVPSGATQLYLSIVTCIFMPQTFGQYGHFDQISLLESHDFLVMFISHC
jgi:hypothetical protein